MLGDRRVEPEGDAAIEPDVTTRTLHFPRFFESHPNGTFTPKGSIFSATDVYVPVALPDSAMFHTVTKCELPDDGDFACESKSLLAGWGREFYVTNGTVFLWTLPHVYGFRFKDLGALAHSAAVTPRDQFSLTDRDRRRR